MENKIKVYTYVDGLNDIPFPNAVHQLAMCTFTYNANRMGGAPSISCSSSYHVCLDENWTGKEYVSFNGENYYLKQIPSSSYSNEDLRYNIRMDFMSERIVLDNTYFFDVVSDTTDNDKYVSNSSNVSFFGDIHEFSSRLNYSLIYSKVGYSVVVDDGISSEAFMMSFEDQFFSQVLDSIFETYQIPYYHVGKVIHIGFNDNVIDHTFKYGHKDALLGVNRDNANYKIINRITGIGSSVNIPYYYPNSNPKGAVIAKASSSNTSILQKDIVIKDLSLYLDNISLNTPVVYKNLQLKQDSISSEIFTNEALTNKYIPNSARAMTISYDSSSYYYNSFRFYYIKIKVNRKSTFDIDWNFGQQEYAQHGGYVVEIKKSTNGSYTYYNSNTPLEIGEYVIRAKQQSMVSSYSVDLYKIVSVSMWANPTFTIRGDQWSYMDLEVKLEDIGISIKKEASINDSFIQETEAYIIPSKNLMPPVYRNSLGSIRFYDAKNNTYINKEDGKYFIFKNEYLGINPKEHKVSFNEINPTIKGMTNDAGQRIDMFEAFDYDTTDNDDLDKENKLIHPYFFGKLRKMDGVNGFNLFEQAIDNGEMTISMTSGKCGACNWIIGVDEETKKNPVKVNASGELLRDKDGNVDRSGAIQDIQQNTQNNSVWIALKKDTDTFGVVMPNVRNNYKPTANSDEFSILNINLPQSYITNAEKKLENEIIKYMASNNSDKFNFSIKFSSIFFAENPHILSALNENSKLKIEYNDTEYFLYVSNYNYKKDDNVLLPSITVSLSDTITINKGTLQNSIDSAKKEIYSQQSEHNFLKEGLNYFIQKNVNDVAKFVTYKDGIDIGNYIPSVSGGTFRRNSDGETFLEVDRLLVKVKAFFENLEIKKKTHVGGEQISSPASMKCIKVEEKDSFFRCYYLVEQDGKKIENEFSIDDQAISKEENINNGSKVSNQYYWRLVVGVGDGYIDLSKGDCDDDSTTPQEGDDIIQLGNRTDKSRQNAIIQSTISNDAPSIKLLSGINSYSLVGKSIISQGFNSITNRAVFNVYGETYIGNIDGSSFIRYTPENGVEINAKLSIGTRFGDGGNTLLDSLTKATEDAVAASSKDLTDYAAQVTKNFDGIQDQIDGAIETWFYDPSPTLSNKPAVDWTTPELKNQHLGDLYYSKEGKSYRFQMSGSSYIWQVLADSDITKALENAKKAQDTADGKRKTFVRQPLNSEDYAIGDLWVNATYSTTYQNDLLRAKTSKAVNAAFSIAHWELASKYTDDTRALEAISAASAAKDAADTAAESIVSLNVYIDGAFKDGVITRTEAQTIAAYINAINNNKLSIDNQYARLYANAYLEGTAKDNLLSAKTALDTSITNLLHSINTAIADKETTTTEKEDVDAKFAIYNTANATFSTRVEEANKAIQDKLKTYSDAASLSASAANTAAIAAQTSATEAKSAVTTLNTYVDGAFKDGVIDIAEAKAIEKYINSVNNTKDSVKATFDKLYANTFLTGAAKTDLNTKYTALNTSITNLIASINTAIADKATTVAEKADVDAKYALFNTAYASFNTSIETANKAIQDNLKGYSDTALVAANAAKADAAKAKEAADKVDANVTTLNTYVDGAFKDGVIDIAEAKAIEKYINSVNESKKANDALYTKLYANPYLEGAAKTGLLTTKTALDTSITNLLHSINTAIADKSTTAAEKVDVDAKYTLYSTDLASFNTAIETANAAIQTKLKTFSDAARDAANAAQTTANSATITANGANALLADIASDSKLTASEKQQTKKEWDVIVSEKPKNDASADLYGVLKTEYGETYDSLNTYITPLLESLTTTSDIVGDTFRTTFKSYYDARTDLLNAIAKKSKELADEANVIASESKNYIDNVLPDSLAGLQAQIDGQIESYFLGYDPLLTNLPASSWTTPADKEKHLNDTFTNNLNGRSWRWIRIRTTYSWLEISDTATTAALRIAGLARDTADGKRRVFVAQPTTPYDVGDLWSQGLAGDIMVCKTERSSGVYTAADWAKASKYTDDSAAKAAAAAAASADAKAAAAADKLTSWAADSSISPTEKIALKQEIKNLDAEKESIVSDAAKYLVPSTAYVAAHVAYNTELIYHSTTSPEVIAIRAAFATSQTAYYTQQKDILNLIATAAKKVATDAQDSANTANNSIAGYSYIKSALDQTATEIHKGLILTSLVALGHKPQGSDFVIKSGLNGLYDVKKPGGGIAFWAGGSMIDLAEYGSGSVVPDDIAGAVDRFDGSGYRAYGNMSWTKKGELTVSTQHLKIVNSTGISKLEYIIADDRLTFNSNTSFKGAYTLNFDDTSKLTIGNDSFNYISYLKFLHSIIAFDKEHDAVRFNKSIYSDGSVSALGLYEGQDFGGGGSGMDETLLWFILGNTGVEQIASNHLSDALRDYVLSNDSRLTNARAASDVYAWAKTPNRPEYNADDVSAMRKWGRSVVDANLQQYRVSGTYGLSSNVANVPDGFDFTSMLTIENGETGLQIIGGYNINKLAFRGWHGNGSIYDSWHNILHSGNFSSYAVGFTDVSRTDIRNHHGYGYVAQGWKTTGPTLSFGSGLYFKQIQGSYNSNTDLAIRTIDNGIYGQWQAFIFEGDVRLTNSRPASDVSLWAKNENKPSYAFSEITGKPNTVAGYGITNIPSWSMEAAKPSYSWLEIKSRPTVFYTLPISTSSVLGGVKQGTNITISADGTISTHAPTTALAWGSITGRPTNLAGYGITDAVSNTDIRLTNARVASDVYLWAKAASKPSYGFSELTGTVPSSALTNYVTVDTVQTIAARKIFAASATFAKTGNATDPTAQPIFINGIDNSSSNGYLPAIGFHIPGINYASIALDRNGCFSFLNHTMSANVPVIASSFIVNGGTGSQMLMANGTFRSHNWAAQSDQPTYLWGTRADNADYVWRADSLRVLSSNNFTPIIGFNQEGGFDVSTMFGNNGGMTSNYGGGAFWRNTPAGMSYGSVVTLSNGYYPNGSLSGQFAWDVDHDVNNGANHLWFRTGNNLGWNRSWDRLFSDRQDAHRLVRGAANRNHGTNTTSFTPDSYSTSYVDHSSPVFMERCTWSYNDNGFIPVSHAEGFAPDHIHLAGTSIIQWNQIGDRKTQLFITPGNSSSRGPGEALLNEMLFYSNNGDGYAAGWTRVLTNRNYNRYSPSNRGSGASGTWGINITGNAGGVKSVYTNDLNAPNWSSEQITTNIYDTSALNKPTSFGNNANGVINFSYGLHQSSGHYGFQISNRTGDQLYYRGWTAGTPGIWQQAASISFTASTYLPLTGGTLSNLLMNMAGETLIRYASSGITKTATGWLSSQGSYIYNYSSSKYLGIYDNGVAHLSGQTIWHAGNDGAGSGLDADTLDGVQFVDLNIPAGDLSSTVGTVLSVKGRLSNYFAAHSQLGIGQNAYVSSTVVYNWHSDSTVLVPSSVHSFMKISGGYTGAGYGQWLLSSYADNQIGIVGRSESKWTDIKWLAFTTDNVASATRLATARSIWGQSFNGSSDVAGKMYVDKKAGHGETPAISLAIGDNDTGFDWVSDGRISIKANGITVGDWDSSRLNVNGPVHGSTIFADNGKLQSTCNGKTVVIGSNNDSYCHYITDAPYHYFNKPIVLDGDLYAYDSPNSSHNIGTVAAPFGAVYTNNWFRSIGTTGWFSETYGGGIYMLDTDYVRVYNGKSFQVTSNTYYSVNTTGGYHSSLDTSRSNTWSNRLAPENHVFNMPLQVVATNTIHNILGWQDELHNRIGYSTRYSISSVRGTTNWGIMQFSVGNSDNGTSGHVLSLGGDGNLTWTDRFEASGAITGGQIIKSGGTSSQLLRADGGVATFNWVGVTGQPAWLWGGNAPHTYQVYSPSNFRVANANTVGDKGVGDILTRGATYSTTPNLWDAFNVSYLNGCRPDGFDYALSTLVYNEGSLMSLNSGVSKFQLFTPTSGILNKAGFLLYGRSGSGASKSDWERILTDSDLSSVSQRSSYSNSISGGVGYYKIKIDSTSSWMTAFTVRLYQTYTYHDIVFSGYQYGGNYWHSPKARLIGGDSSITVHFGYDNVGALWVAVPAGYYTGIEICNVTNGYVYVPNFATKFNITRTSSLTTIQSTQTIYPPLATDVANDTYLKLTGGALTGTLTGTNCGFSGQVVATTVMAMGAGIFNKVINNGDLTNAGLATFEDNVTFNGLSVFTGEIFMGNSEYSGLVLTGDSTSLSFGNDTKAFHINGDMISINAAGQIGSMEVLTGAVYINGDLNVSGRVYSSSGSDIRLKKNFNTIDANEILLSLGEVRSYEYNDIALNRKDSYEREGVHIGLVYQNVIDVLPQMSIMNKDGYGGLNYIHTDYINLIAAAAQQTYKLVEENKIRIEELEYKIKELENEILINKKTA